MQSIYPFRPNPVTRLLAGLVILAIVAAFPTPSASVPAQAQASFQKGITFSTWTSGGYSVPGADESLAQLKSTGAEWVALIVTGVMTNHLSLTIDIAGPERSRTASLPGPSRRHTGRASR